MATIRKAMAAIYLERYIVLGLSFLTIAISSRFLTPREIGLSILGATYIQFAEAFRDFGVTNYLVNSKTVTLEVKQTAFTVVFAVALLLSAFIMLSAEWYAGLYNEPSLIPFIQLVAISFIFAAFASPILAMLRRELEFGRVSLVNIASAVVSNAVILALAALGYGYMSFAWGSLCWPAANLVFAFMLRPETAIYYPRLKGWREVVSFGGYTTVTGMLNQVVDMLPIMALGRTTTLAGVANYSRAYQLCQIPGKFLYTTAAAIALPAFAQHIRDGGDLKRPFLLGLTHATAIQWPALLLLALLAHPIVTTALGTQWVDVVPLMQILALSSLLAFTNGLSTPALIAAGGVRDTMIASFIWLPLCGIITISAALQGPLILALSTFVTIPLQLFVTLWFLQKRIQLSYADIASALAASAALSAVSMAGPAVIWAANGFRFEMPLSVVLSIGALWGAGWIIGLRVTKHPMAGEVVRILRALERAAPVTSRFTNLLGRMLVGPTQP
ncbi:MAG: oligosaccharide flippase family protein [Chitinophagales bacterium]|nr:oligosaccharide flippase family protein [Hyphomicrobiales bacterium]